MVDHIDHDTLNNTRNNLRFCTSAENQQNQKLLITNTSGVRGVFWDKSKRRWRAEMIVNKRKYRFGLFKEFQQAEAAIIEARAKMMPFSQEAMKKPSLL